MNKGQGKGDLGKAYLNEWKARDAAERANGMPPSKLGPGVPAITTIGLSGTTVWDDNGMKIPGGKGKA